MITIHSQYCIELLVIFKGEQRLRAVRTFRSTVPSFNDTACLVHL